MVVPSYIKDILQTLDDSTVLNLPIFKEKILKLEYVKCDNNDVHFKAGDTIAITPRNRKEEVDILIKYLGLEKVADTSYTLTLDCDRKDAKIPPHIPIKATLRFVLTYCIDLRGILKKVFLVVLSKYTTDESEKKVLEYLSSKEGFLAYTSNILNKSICILDIFQMFKSCRPPVEVILEHLPRLLPRPYSICNTYLKDPNKLKICFSVKEIGNDRKGLTTSWLEELITTSDDVEKNFEKISLKGNKKVPIYFRKNINEFRLPENTEAPMILVGPGTGVAPFMGFLEEREIKMNENSSNVPCVWLFNGCRYESFDFIYKNELKDFVSKGVLSKITTAFSRDENSKCRYVQDCIAEHGEEVTKLIEDGAYIFVCGDVNKMAKDVKETIIKCVEQYTDRTYEEAVQFITELEKQKRYVVDIWN
ncbi:methionine synthase reductase-like isoform X2 [Aricia agestis]|uniref:methionine synthase reductase-like isoform X2 n=1 Tax=Aricia agestis TaxID=91739 RepID=UPI001C20173C|nr:methionine synthase reductase-like isoform X2 [Aricia agestis]